MYIHRYYSLASISLHLVSFFLKAIRFGSSWPIWMRMEAGFSLVKRNQRIKHLVELQKLNVCHVYTKSCLNRGRKLKCGRRKDSGQGRIQEMGDTIFLVPSCPLLSIWGNACCHLGVPNGNGVWRLERMGSTLPYNTQTYFLTFGSRGQESSHQAET